MKIKKLAAALTVGALTLSLAAPALAAEAADARLAQVTLAVKGILDISDAYTEFYGEPNETPLGTRWDLSWSSDSEQLQITAAGAGKIVSLNRWEKGKDQPVYVSVGRSAPAFPPMTMAQARTHAQAFLDKVLASNEKVEFEENESESLSAASYTFRGSVTLNGLPSPMTVSVRVRLSDGEITRFWRGDVSDYAGEPSAPAAVTTADKAREQLRSTLDMRLEYVLDWDGKEGSGKKAVLRYLPNFTDEFYVDAATGELVNLTELREKLRRDAAAGGDMAANKFMASGALDAAAPEAAPTLTPTELEGVAKLEDVLDKDVLDGKIRAWKELGLDKYTLGSVNYSVDREDSSVTARVSYAKNTDEGIYRRNVTVNAKTGELISMYGYGPSRYELHVIDGKEEKTAATITAKNAQAKASAFLTKLWGEQFARTGVYNGPDAAEKAAGWGFTFAQKENGYFFPGNSISASVDADGYITGFSKSFDDEVAFDSADGLVGLDAAVDAWCQSYPVELGYLEVPIALDMREQFMPLRNAGYTYYNALKPGYAFGAQDGWCSGVDAKTGQVVREEREEAEKMAYSDLDGHWARDILDELARFSVGWLGGKAEPDKTLTQLDYLKLLASMDGYTVTQRDENGWDWLYDYAYRQGLLTKEERSEDEAVTRSGMVKMLLNSLGYGDVARLPGIFRCDFADAASIPAADLGYAALAQGLGIISGDGEGNYAPARTSTRAEAAVLVWNYLKR